MSEPMTIQQIEHKIEELDKLWDRQDATGSFVERSRTTESLGYWNEELEKAKKQKGQNKDQENKEKSE